MDIYERNEKIIHELEGYFSYPNRTFFKKLSEIVFSDPDKRVFRLERLNDGSVKPNTLCPFAVPVRTYAKKLAEIFTLDGSKWKALTYNGDILCEKEDNEQKRERISRSSVIALAFVFRLSSDELNELLEKAGYCALYARSVPDAALIYSLDTYKGSEEYKKFQDVSAELSDSEYIQNYGLFNQLLKNFQKLEKNQNIASESTFAQTLEKCCTKAQNEERRSRITWTLIPEELKKLESPQNQHTLNLTQRSTEDLREAVEDGISEGYGNTELFEEFMDDNHGVFVQNRERALRCLVTMIIRYLDNNPKKSCDLTTMVKEFTDFMDRINLRSAGKVFLWRYFCEGTDHEDIQEFAQEYDIPVSEAKGKFYDCVCIALSMTHPKYKRKKTATNAPLDKSELDKSERAMVGEIIAKEDSDKIPTENMSQQFKRILSGKADISRLLFIFFYLFAARRPGESASRVVTQDKMRELDSWLTKSGFLGIWGDALESFVFVFLESSANQCRVNDSLDWSNEMQSRFFVDIFTSLLSRNLKIDNLIQLDLNASSLYEEEMSLLLAEKEPE